MINFPDKPVVFFKGLLI